MTIQISLVSPEHHAEFTSPIRTAFGLQFDADRAARMQHIPEMAHRIGAYDGDHLVGTAAGFLFEMTTPGGKVPVSGLTMVAVLPTHRRQGILTKLIHRHFEESITAGLPISALWASEAQIYGRFGYGMATQAMAISIERDRAGFKRAAPAGGTLRLLGEKDAAEVFPPIYDRVRTETPGMLSRSAEWWHARRIGDFDTTGSPMQRVLLTVAGEPQGYAIYRMEGRVSGPGIMSLDLAVTEAVAVSPQATAMLWRYLFDIDLVRNIKCASLPPGHPLVTLVAENRRLRTQVEDAVWVRLLHVEAALQRRSFPKELSLTFEVVDSMYPSNTGIYSIQNGHAKRADGAPELRMDIASLSSLYLGGVGCRQLADAGDIEELMEAAVHRAELLFRSPRAPWCPEIF